MQDAFDRLREICLALPEAIEKPFGGHTAPAFRVRDKMFASCMESRPAVTMKAPPGAQEILVGADPETFFVPPYVGAKRLDRRPSRRAGRLGCAGGAGARQLSDDGTEEPGEACQLIARAARRSPRSLTRSRLSRP